MDRDRKTWGESVMDDMKLLCLEPKWVNVQGNVEQLDMGQTSNPSLP